MVIDGSDRSFFKVVLTGLGVKWIKQIWDLIIVIKQAGSSPNYLTRLVDSSVFEHTI